MAFSRGVIPVELGAPGVRSKTLHVLLLGTELVHYEQTLVAAGVTFSTLLDMPGPQFEKQLTALGMLPAEVRKLRAVLVSGEKMARAWDEIHPAPTTS